MAKNPGNSRNQIPDIFHDGNHSNDSNDGANANVKFRAHDLPTQKLLLEVAKNIEYSKANLVQLATDVGMPQGLFSQKTAMETEALMKIFEVAFVIFWPRFDLKVANTYLN